MKQGDDDFVDQYYKGDPLSEDLLYIEQLRDGMVVLIADPHHRCELFDQIEMYPPQYYDACKMNRWAVVTEFAIDDAAMIQFGDVSIAGEQPNLNLSIELNGMVDSARFIAVYPDGSKAVQNWPKGTGWLVKMGSIPKEPNEGVNFRKVDSQIIDQLNRMGKKLRGMAEERASIAEENALEKRFVAFLKVNAEYFQAPSHLLDTIFRKYAEYCAVNLIQTRAQRFQVEEYCKKYFRSYGELTKNGKTDLSFATLVL
jgi:hypothetical protein